MEGSDRTESSDLPERLTRYSVEQGFIGVISVALIFAVEEKPRVAYDPKMIGESIHAQRCQRASVFSILITLVRKTARSTTLWI